MDSDLLFYTVALLGLHLESIFVLFSCFYYFLFLEGATVTVQMRLLLQMGE